MKYVTLGKTGLKVSKIGLGGIPIQKNSAEEVKELLMYLMEQGVNYVDSARGYTVSEALLGEAMEGHRDRFIIATKSMSVTKEDMARDIDISLKNFRTDYIDLYQIHNPSMENLEKILSEGGAMEALREAKAEGKIGHIGLTAHSTEVFEKALSLDEIETIMFPYNIVEFQGTELIRKAAEKNVGFIDMKPLAGGAIEDGRLALRYICANPDVTIVIPGMYSVEEAKQNIEAVLDESPLSEEEKAGFDKVRGELGENFCRRCNYCQPCSAGINIANVFLFAGYLQRYDLGAWGYDRYMALPVKPEACVDCGLCETRCPYHLPIREMLRKCAADFADYEKNLK